MRESFRFHSNEVHYFEITPREGEIQPTYMVRPSSDEVLENDSSSTVTASSLSEEEQQMRTHNLQRDMNNEDAVLALMLPALLKLQLVNLMKL